MTLASAQVGICPTRPPPVVGVWIHEGDGLSPFGNAQALIDTRKFRRRFSRDTEAHETLDVALVDIRPCRDRFAAFREP